MIAKGTPHTNGARLASYMVTGKDGERASLHELRGFAEADIVSAFRSVHIEAQATRCKQPFFHAQVRNPAGEHLTRAQWVSVADRIEKKLGLVDQPRAIAFHAKDGDEHMHVAWSRIDAETMKAKPLPFFKLRLKEVCRQLEAEFGLTKVRNQREPGEPRAPSRAERDQATRLGVDIEAVRGAIRDAWHRSDSGAAFLQALDDRGLKLARGDKRDFVVIDGQGGIHALGKRTLGVTAAETRNRLSDLAPGLLLTVAAAREHQAAEHTQPAASTRDQDEEARRQGTCSDNAGMVAQNAEANRRHLELNPFLRSQTQARETAPDRASITDDRKQQPDAAMTAEEKQRRVDELARQITERWGEQARDIGPGRDR